MIDGGERKRGRRAIWVLPLVIAALAVIVFSGYKLSSIVGASAHGYEIEVLREKTQLAAKLVNVQISSAQRLLEMLAKDAAKGKRVADDISDYEALFGILRIGYATPDGRQSVVSSDETNGRVVNVANEPFFISAMDGAFAVQGAKYDALSQGEPTAYISAPIKTKTGVEGVITASFDPDALSRIIDSVGFDEHSVTFLCDGDDDILSADDEAINSFKDELSLFDASREAFISYTDEKGAHSHAVRESVGVGELSIVCFISGGISAFDGINAVLPWIVPLGAAICVILLILALILFFQNRRTAAISRDLAIKDGEFRLAMEQSGKFVCRYDMSSGKLLIPSEYAEMFGLPRVVIGVRKTLAESGVIDAGCREAFEAFAKSIRTGENSGSAEICLKPKLDANPVWYRAGFLCACDAGGKPVCAVISLSDITKRRQRQAQQKAWMKEMEQIPGDRALILEWSLLKDRYDGCSGQLKSLDDEPFGAKLDAFIKDYADSRVFEDDKDAFLNMLKRERLIGAYYDGITGDETDYRCLTLDDYRWMKAKARLVACADDDEVKLYITLLDIDGEKRASLIEYEKANTDALTGAVNLRSFEQRVSKALSSSRSASQHALIMLDVSQYDEESDSYCHITGDAVLKDLVARVKTALLRDDIIARIGGDEFMIFLNDIPYDAIVGQKLRHICEMLRQTSAGEISARVNLGVAMYPQDGTSYNELYQNAYVALYRIKEHGFGGYAFFSGRIYDADRGDSISLTGQHSRHMLIASACESEREALENAFEDGYRIIKAKDGDGVFIQLMRYAPSLCCVILDLDIPGQNGYDIMSYMSKNEAYTNIPVIAVSKQTGPQAQLDAISAGAADYLEKPVDTGLMRIKVLCALKRVDNDIRRVQKSYSLFQSSHEERYRRVLDATGTLVFTHDLTDDRYVYGADASKYLYGVFDSRPLDRILIEDCAANVSKVTQMMLSARKVAQGSLYDEKAEYILRLKTPAGDMHWFKAQFIRMDSKGELTRKMLITFNDMNDEVEASEAIKFRAERDMLTRLYNSETFYDKVREMIAQTRPGAYTLCSVDVDNFKVLNDQYGRAEGDKLLVYIALMLREAVEPVGGICCRVWADSFAYAFPNSPVSTKYVFRAIEKKCAEYTGLTSFKLSTGAYVIDDASMPVDLIYDRATIAKKSIKGNYLHHIAFYTDYMRDEILAEQAVVAQMENALKTDQFEVYLQPQFALNTSSLVGAEALVRWNHPEKGIISPAHFIPIFEKNGFISRLDRYVWKKTLGLIRSWMDKGQKLVPLSINVSRSELLDSDFFSYITGAIESFGVPKELFNVEITETAFAGAPEIIVDTVKRLKEYGIVVEIDDFGSGYSSLNTLKDVPADILKLDMRFMDDTGDARRGGAIVNSIIRMARWLNMAVIAEGVETREQAAFLRSIGCRYAQGYLYAHPMKAEEFERLKDEALFKEVIPKKFSNESPEAGAYWNPASEKTSDFNNSNTATAIAEYSVVSETLDIIRANEMFLMSFTAYLGAGDGLFGKDVLSFFSSATLPRAKEVIKSAVANGGEAAFDATLTPEMGGARLRIIASVVNRSLDCALLRLTIEDIP